MTKVRKIKILCVKLTKIISIFFRKLLECSTTYLFFQKRQRDLKNSQSTSILDIQRIAAIKKKWRWKKPATRHTKMKAFVMKTIRATAITPKLGYALQLKIEKIC